MKYDRFIFFGCSFTYSQDCASNISLLDTGSKIIEYPPGTTSTFYTDINHSYPALVSQHYGVQFENLGVPKNNNESMAHQMYNWIHVNQDQIDFDRTLFVINATSSYRTSTTQFAQLHPQIKFPVTSNHFPILLARTNYLSDKSKHSDIPHSVKKQAQAYVDFLIQEQEDFLVMRNLFTLMGMKNFAASQGINSCVIDLLFCHERYKRQPGWYHAGLLDQVFLNDTSLYAQLLQQGIVDHNDTNGYINAHSKHFTQDGYQILADKVIDVISGIVK